MYGIQPQQRPPAILSIQLIQYSQEDPGQQFTVSEQAEFTQDSEQS